MSDALGPTRAPISALGVIASQSKAPDGFYVVAQTTDGCDADLWKDTLFKSKVTRYLCFTRKHQEHVVVDVKLIDVKDALPLGFAPVQETLDTKEAALQKKRLCVKLCPRATAKSAVNDVQIIGKSKQPLVNYTCVGEMNNMGIWYRREDILQEEESSQSASTSAASERRSNVDSPPRVTTSRSEYKQQNSAIYTLSAMDGVPFVVSEKFDEALQGMQRVNLMGITIKSLAEIEEEFHYNFTTELSIGL